MSVISESVVSIDWVLLLHIWKGYGWGILRIINHYLHMLGNVDVMWSALTRPCCYIYGKGIAGGF